MEARNRGLGVSQVNLVGNLLGAALTFFYFRFVDYRAAIVGGVTAAEIVYSVIAFAALSVVGFTVGRMWSRPLRRKPVSGRDEDAARVRRRAILVPYVNAGLALVGWGLAGLLWGAVWPFLHGHFSLLQAVRSVFGITCIAGTVTAAFIFFSVEHVWRKRLAEFFPEGGLATVPGVLRFPVRTRVLVIFLMMSIIPLALLGVVSYTRAAALLGSDAAAAAGLVGDMLAFIVFILAVGSAAAVGLSVYVANSVATPLRAVESAMAEVERGNLTARCPVVTNDEIGAVAEGFNRMVHGLRERDFIKETFGKYVTREIRDEILAGRVSLDGQAGEVTILFSDLRDFTSWVEASEPREILRDLNAYFAEMEQAIRDHRGLVLQFIGDEIEAVFGAPLAYGGHADMAVRAALDMRRRLTEWNGHRERAGKAPLRHGIGIHTGTVLAGNVGSGERLSYALVGDPVNLASRIQDLTKQSATDILISGSTRHRLGGRYDLEPLPAVRVKGKSTEVEVYRLRR